MSTRKTAQNQRENFVENLKKALDKWAKTCYDVTCRMYGAFSNHVYISYSVCLSDSETYGK